MVNQELWESVLAQIQLNISQANFNAWFKNTKISSIDGPEIFISVPNSFTKEWLENKYNKIILKTLNETAGRKLKKINYCIDNKDKLSFKNYIKHPVNTSQLEFTQLKINQSTNLNPRYTFENFVVGPFNELPHAAARAVAQNPGSFYNPLFIYGGVGLGKTHLMQAIGNEIYQNLPDKKIRYISVEKFTSEVVSSIRNKSMDKFKEKYREIDILIIDDIQFLSGKEKTQEEFFHTFNVLYENNKQIVISSDRPPRSIQALAERLKSRFEGGMITDISHPDVETRMAILKTKAQEKDVDFSDEVYLYLATNIQNNIRELEGALNKLIAHQNLKNQKIDIKKTKEIFKDLFKSSVNVVTPKKVMKAISQFYDIKEKELSEPSRKKEIVRPRQIAMHILRNDLNHSLPFIGRMFGGRDHTTVMYSCDKIEKELETNENLKEEIELIKQYISSL
ncbi:MAG: chromosomal replication initiator protein DnaA [Minisyncoccales bacterium]|jgi:chromosomal replication initiator protein